MNRQTSSFSDDGREEKLAPSTFNIEKESDTDNGAMIDMNMGFM